MTLMQIPTDHGTIGLNVEEAGHGRSVVLIHG